MIEAPATPAWTPIRLRTGMAIAMLLAVAALAPQAPAAADAGDPVRQTLEQARAAGNRGVTVHVQGSTVALVVTAVEAGFVIGRSAQHDRIVVRIDRIDAVAF